MSNLTSSNISATQIRQRETQFDIGAKSTRKPTTIVNQVMSSTQWAQDTGTIRHQKKSDLISSRRDFGGTKSNCSALRKSRCEIYNTKDKTSKNRSTQTTQA